MSKKKLIHLPSDDKSGDKWRTPKLTFNELNNVTPFFLDACSNDDNCLVNNIIDYEHYNYLNFDVVEYYKYLGLTYIEEGYSIFINPPYSNVTPFIRKAWDDSRYFRVVMLLKADMSTNWFNEDLIDKSRNWRKHVHQAMGIPLNATYQVLLNYMKDDKLDIGILHLRKRVRHYVSEEVFEEDKEYWIDLETDELGTREIDNNKYDYVPGMPDGEPEGRLIETKHYKRVEDGICSKSGSNFASMIVILDRRGNNERNTHI